MGENPRRRPPAPPAVQTVSKNALAGDELGSRSMISSWACDIITGVKQLLLRVPEELHRRLAARAAKEGRSINAVATEILDGIVDADQADRRTRLRAKAVGSGLLHAVPAKKVSSSRRRRILTSTQGVGPIADRLIDEQRDRL